MAKHVQFIQQTTAVANAYIGYPGEITVDTDLNNLRVHDGSTPGGFVIQNEPQYALLSVRRFTAVATHSTPGSIPDADLAKFLAFSLAGTYTLPLLSAASVGTPVFLEASVDSVIVEAAGSDQITDQGADVTQLSLTQDEVVEIVKYSTSRWKVINRY